MTDAERLFFAGGAHARAAHAIVHAARQDVHMVVPFYLLLGFALETVLKAAFIQLGGDMKAAKYDIGHDLPKALAHAQALGFQPDNEHLAWLIETMAQAHRNHEFRYLSGDDELRVAEETWSLRILDDLIVQVGSMLHPEHDRKFWLERLTQFEATHF